MLAIQPVDPSSNLGSADADAAAVVQGRGGAAGEEKGGNDLELDSPFYMYWKRVIKFMDANYFMCLAFFGIVFAAIVPFIGTYLSYPALDPLLNLITHK